MTIDWQQNLRDSFGCKSINARDRERLLRSISIVGQCWIYLGPTSRSGRGLFGVGGRGLDVRDAAYAMLVGPCEAGVTTTCGNKVCCCPDHLVVQDKHVMAAE